MNQPEIDKLRQLVAAWRRFSEHETVWNEHSRGTFAICATMLENLIPQDKTINQVRREMGIKELE